MDVKLRRRWVGHTKPDRRPHTYVLGRRLDSGVCVWWCVQDLDLVQVNNCLYCSPATVAYGDKLFAKAPVCLLHPMPSMAASNSQQDPLVPGQRCQLGAQIVMSPGQGRASVARTRLVSRLRRNKTGSKTTFLSSWLKALVAWKLLDCFILWPSFIRWECLHMTGCVVDCGSTLVFWSCCQQLQQDCVYSTGRTPDKFTLANVTVRWAFGDSRSAIGIGLKGFEWYIFA